MTDPNKRPLRERVWEAMGLPIFMVVIVGALCRGRGWGH